MKPISHILLTLTAFMALNVFLNMKLIVLAIAILLTLFIDIIDHSSIILLIKDEVTAKVRKLATDMKLKEAYRIYSKERYKIGKAFLHNLAFFVVITVIGIIYKSPVILIGITFHFVCDMISDIYFMKRLNDNWTFVYLFKRKVKNYS